MSTPIKPPGGAPPKPPDSVDAPSGAKSSGAKESFRSALDEAPLAPDAAKPAQGVASTDPIRPLVAELKAGRIDVHTVVDRLVEHAVEGGSARALTPAGRRELESFLRRALEEDPTLLALLKDMERAR